MSSEFQSLQSGTLSVSVSSSPEQSRARHGQTLKSAADLCRDALASPLGVPELNRCVVPGDNVVIAVDPETPFVVDILISVWEHLGMVPEGGVALTLLFPQDESGQNWQTIRDQLPLPLQEVRFQVHDPEDRTGISYLASSAAGERIYMSRALTDADLIVTIGLIAFDDLLGYRGTTSGLYPSFSDTEARRQIQSHGHPELTPDQPRPLRDLIDEIGWLLGTQFAVQVIPGPADGPAAILAGFPEPVMAQGRELTNTLWRMAIDEQVDGIVLSVPGGSPYGWKQLGRALEQATQLVQQGGRIVVLADLQEPTGPGATMLRRTQEPEELLKPLQREPVSDSVEMIQLIQAMRRARVYLLSQLNPEVVEELGMIPIADTSELQRLVSVMQQFRILPNANFAWCEVSGRASS